MEYPFSVVFEDNHLLVVNKNAGLLVQSDHTKDLCLVDFAKQYLTEKYQKTGNVFCGVVHRLDRPVSGLVILAKTSKALERMNDLFREHQLEKIYLAVVDRKPKNETDTLVHWLAKNSLKKYSMVFTKETPNSQRAELDFAVLATQKQYSLLKVSLKTGRFHQIRAQLSKIGSTIVGDLKYGASKPNPDASICLHSFYTSFVHPIKQEQIKIFALPPNQFAWEYFSETVASLLAK